MDRTLGIACASCELEKRNLQNVPGVSLNVCQRIKLNSNQNYTK